MGRRLPTGIDCEGGVCFRPCPDGGTYKSLYDHRGNRPGASCWRDDYPPPLEFLLFISAFHANWMDATGHLWAVDASGRREIGTRRERLAKFPANAQPASVEWHGFPVSPQLDGVGSAPPDTFVQAWIDGNVVSRALGRKIQKRRL
jgi:hypothetical protein